MSDDSSANIKVHPLLEYAAQYKVKAASYHLNFMGRIFDDGLLTPEAMRRLKGVERSEAFARSDELTWHFEAFMFQLYSAFDVVLQELSLRRNLELDMEDVKWNPVSNKLPDDPVVIHLRGIRKQEWFRRLRESRHEAMHRHPPITTALVEGDHIKALAFGWRTIQGGRGGPPVFSTCEKWLEAASDALKKAVRMMRDESSGA